MDLSTQRSRRAPVVLCFFSHHRPWLVEADLGILKVAEEKGWKTEKVWEDKEAGVSQEYGVACAQEVMGADEWRARLVSQPAFPEDGGDLAIRSTVHGYAFWRE